MTKATRRVVDGGAAGLDVLAFSTSLQIKNYLTTNEVEAVFGASFRTKSTRNGAWVVGEAAGGITFETADTSGGGPGVAAALRAVVIDTFGISFVARLFASSTTTRDLPCMDFAPDAMLPVANGTASIGSSALQFLQGFIRTLFFGAAGAQKLTSVAGTPEGVVTAEVGSIVTDLTNGVVYVKRTGAGNTGFAIQGDIQETATAASIAAIGNAINTTGKRLGKVVWDSTNNRAMRASGTTAGSAWHVLDGSATVTPA